MFSYSSCFYINAFAHSGKTDADGGHNDNIHGGYHYHHGYSAHDHYNGECPYEIQSENYYDYEKEEYDSAVEIYDDITHRDSIDNYPTSLVKYQETDYSELIFYGVFVLLPVTLEIFCKINEKDKK